MRGPNGTARAWILFLPISVAVVALAGCATRQQFEGIESGVKELKADSEERSGEIDALREMILAEHDLILSAKADVLAEISGLREQIFQMENRITSGGGPAFLEPTSPPAGQATGVEGTSGAGAIPDAGDAGAVEEGTRVSEGAMPPPGAGGESAAAGATGVDERAAYDTAFLDMTRGNYDLAIEGFQTFIAGPGARQLRDNAQYWIGECYYAKGDLRRAIEAFEHVVDDYAGGNKVPSALFKIGKCYYELGDSDAAARYFRSVVDGYPRSEEANLAQDYLTEL